MKHATRLRLHHAAILAALVLLAPALFAQAPPTLKVLPMEIRIPDAGKTGLEPGVWVLKPAKEQHRPGETVRVSCHNNLKQLGLALNPTGCQASRGEQTEVLSFSWGGARSAASTHPGGVHALLADGSVRFNIPSNEDPACRLVGTLAVQRRPEVGSTALTPVEKEPTSAPPRDQGDPGPQPMEVEPGLTDPSSAPRDPRPLARKELADFPGRQALEGLGDERLQAGALRLRQVLEQLARTPPGPRSETLWKQYLQVLDNLGETARAVKPHTKTFQCLADKGACKKDCGGCCCGCGAAFVGCLIFG